MWWLIDDFVSTCAHHAHNWELLIERSLPRDNIQADTRFPPTQSSLASLEKCGMCLFCSSFLFDLARSDLGCCGVRSRDEAEGSKIRVRLQDLSWTFPWTRGAPWSTHHHSLGLGRRKLLVLLPKWWKELAFSLPQRKTFREQWCHHEGNTQNNTPPLQQTPQLEASVC